jgi:endonuclease YncB( thermonuclease family)
MDKTQWLVAKVLIYPVFVIFFFVQSPSAIADQFRVTKVLDGDTIVLDNDERVRLIGVNTNEKFHPLKPVEYYSKEATKFTKELVEGKKARLEYDVERRGKYGRLLAYVYLMDGTFVNAEIIKQGFGFAYRKYPFKYMDEFIIFENEAKINRRGYWKYGGAGELNWIIEKKQKPFKIFYMSQDLWGIRYNSFIKTRLTDDQLTASINNLRQWVIEFHYDDLRKKLLISGWEEWGKK